MALLQTVNAGIGGKKARKSVAENCSDPVVPQCSKQSGETKDGQKKSAQSLKLVHVDKTPSDSSESGRSPVKTPSKSTGAPLGKGKLRVINQVWSPTQCFVFFTLSISVKN